MKKTNRLIISTIGIVLITLLTIGASLLANVVTNSSSISWLQSSSWVGLVILSILGALIVIVQIIHEKQAHKPDDNKVTTVTKSIGVRVRIEEGPVTIEAPDVESAIKVLQGIHENSMKSENLLKAESQSTMKETKPEASDIPDTKETEK